MAFLKNHETESKVSTRTRSLSTVDHWSHVYLKQQDKVMKSTDTAALEQFLEELEAFIESVRSRWMKKTLDQLRPETQKRLRNILQALVRLQRDVIYRLRQVERDKSLLEKMEDLAFPESTTAVASRDYSTWPRSPFYHSPKLIEAAKEMPTPH